MRIEFLSITGTKVPIGSERITLSLFLGRGKALGPSLAVSYNWSRLSMDTVFNNMREAIYMSTIYVIRDVLRQLSEVDQS